MQLPSTRPAALSRNLARWSWLVSIPLAAVFLYLALRGVDWKQVGLAITHARPAWLVCAAAITTCTCFLRGLRWRVLLNAEADLAVGTVFRATMVGYLANNFLPARAGEVLRSVLISRASRLSNVYVLTTAFAERLMDVIAVVLAAALALWGIDPKPRWLADLSRSMSVAAAAGVVAVVVLPHSGGLIENLLQRLPLGDRIRRFLQATASQVLLGIRAFHDWGRLAGFSALTALIWTGDGLGVIAGARALDLSIPFPVAMLLLTAMALGSALPSTPGYIGIYQFAAVMILGPFGIPKDRALAYSFVMQAVGYTVITGLGLPCLASSGVGLRGGSERGMRAAR
jgi:glycosyltransferase 2 family protein